MHFAGLPTQVETPEASGVEGGGQDTSRAGDGGPVFVPIVMKMAEADHDLLLRQHYSSKQVGLSDPPPAPL